uniref:KNTC1 first ARM-repeats domain-containing protein n=1 Tax=Schistocephalus solidus TaxID=70667 RepID=A0A0V0J799_SCHSO
MSKDLGDRDSFVGFREFPWENHVFSLKALSTFTLDFNDEGILRSLECSKYAPLQIAREYQDFLEPRITAAFPANELCFNKSQFLNRGYFLALNRQCQLLLYNIVAGICCGPLFSGGDIIDFAVWKGAFMQSEVKNSPFPTFGVCLLRRGESEACLEVHLFPSRELVFATTVSEQSHLISTVGPNVSPLLVEVDAPSSDHGGLQTVSSFVRIDPLERLKCFIKENDFERAKRFSQIFGLDTKFVRSAELFYCLESLAEAAEKLEEFTEEEDQKVATEYISLEETVQRAIRLLSKPVDCTFEMANLAVRGVIPALRSHSDLLLSIWKKIPENSEEGQLLLVTIKRLKTFRLLTSCRTLKQSLWRKFTAANILSVCATCLTAQYNSPDMSDVFLLWRMYQAEFKSELDSNLVRKYLHVLAQRPLTTDRAPAKAAALIESEEALHTWLQTEFLNVIILHCPDALGAIATWLIDRVQMLERVCQNQTDSELDKQCPFKWPSTAISWIRGLLAAVPKVNLEPVESKANDFYSSPLTPREEVRSYCSGLCSRTFGVDPFAELRSLLCDLEHIKRLLDTYQFRLLLVDCRKLSPQNIVFKMLDVTLASGAGTNIPPRIESYIKSNKLNPDQVYAAYCSEILENLKVDLDDGTFSAFTTLSNFSKTPKREEAVTQRTVASSQLIHKEVIRACIAASWIRSSVYRCKVTYLLSGITPLPWPAELHQVVDETLRLYHRPGTLPALDRVLCFSNVAKAVDILSRLGVAFDLADLRPRPLLCRILLLAHPPWTSGRGAVAAARVSKHPKEILLDALRVAYYLKPSLQGHSSTVSGAYGPQAYWLRELCSLYLEQILEEVIAVWDEVGEVEIHDRLDIVLPAISQLTDIATNFADYTGFTDGGDGGDGGATVSSVDPEGREFLWRRWLYDSCFCWLRNRLRVVKVSNQTAITYFRLAAHVSCLALRAKVCSREANLWLSYTSMMERLIILTSSSMFCPQIPPELAENISPVAGVQLARHLFSSILCPLLHSEDSKLPFSPARVSAFQTLLFWLCGHSTRDACFPLDDLISLYLFEIWLRDSQPASATLLSALDDLFQRLHRNPVSCSGKHSVQAPGQLFFKSDSSCTYWDVWDSGLGRLGFLVRLLSESLLPSVLRCCSLSGDADQHSLTASSWDFDAAQGQAATAFAIVVRVVDLVDFTAISYCFGRPDLAEFVYCLRRTVSILRTVFSKFLDAFSSDTRSENPVDTDLTKLKLWALRGEGLRENLSLEAIFSFTINALSWLHRFFSLVLQPGVLLYNKDPISAESTQSNSNSNVTVDGKGLPSLFVDGIQIASILATKVGLVDSAALPLSCILVELVLNFCATANEMRCFMASMDGEAGQVYTDLLTNQLPQWLACSVRKHFTSSRPNHAMVLGLSLSLPFTMANSCLRQVIVDSPSATNRIKSITAMLVKSHCLQPLIYTPSLVKGVLDILRRAQWDAALRPYGLRMSRRDPRPDLVLQYLIDMVPTLCIPPSPTISASSSVKPLPPIALLAKFCTAFKQNLWTALLNHLRNLLCPPDFNGFAPLHSTQQYSQPQPDATLKVGEVGIFTPNPLVIATKVFSETRQSRAQEILRCLLTFLHQQGSTNPETILALRRDLEQCLYEGLQSTWPFDYEQIRFVLNALTVLGSDLIESRHRTLLQFLETHRRQSPVEVIPQVHPLSSTSAPTWHPLHSVRLPFHQLLSPSADLAIIGPELNRHNLRDWLQLSAQMQWNLTDRMCLRTASNCFTPLVRMGLVRVIDGPVAAAADAFKFFPYTTSADRSNECWEEALAADALLGPALTEAFSFLVSVTDPVRTLKFLADLFIRLQDGPPKLAFLNLIRRLVRHWNYIHSPYKEPVSSFKGGAESSDLYWINLALSEADACEQKLQIEACLHRFQVTTFWPSVLLYTPTSTALVEFLLEQASRLLSQKATRIAEDREAAYPTQHSNRRHIVPLLYDALREILRLQGVDFEIWSRQLVWQRLQLPKSICSEWVREENVDLDATAITFDPESSALLDNTAADISLNMTISSPPGALRSAKVCDDVRQNSDEDDFNLAEFLFASPWHPSSERISPSLDFAPVLDLLRTWSTPSPNLIASMQASELNRRWRAARLVLRCSAVSQTTDFPQHHLDLLALAVRFHAESARVFLPASLRSSLASHMMAFIASGDGADDFLHTLLQLANSGDHSLGLVRNLAVNLLVDGHLADSATAARSILEGLICRQPRWPSSLTPLLLRLQEFILTDRCTTVPWRAEEPALAKTDWHAFWRSCDGVGSFGPALISHLLRHWSSTTPPPALLPHLVSLLLSWPLSLPVSVSNALRQYCAALGNRISSCSILRQLEQLVEEMSPMASARMPLSEEQEDEKENHRPPTDQEGFRKQFTSSKSPSSLTTALVDSGI